MFDVMTLSAALTLDTKEYEQGLTDAEKKAEKAGGAIGRFLGNGTVAAVKGIAAATAAASAGVVALAKKATDSYANFEQLVGGVETLFGQSADKVQEYANNAFKTTGMSANQYMETVTGFSASLLQSLGGDTAKAADVADMAMRDMSDNANKMGTSMESIKNAYQGFAKQNYTMLDNLKLGYGGTKSEMERLLVDAEAISGVHYDISSFSDMAEAIHVVQQEMGITGTTAKEASDTITGSMASAKAAWDNLVTGLADENANLGDLITTFLAEAEGAATNMLPRFMQALEGVGQFVEEAVPRIMSRLPEILGEIVPQMMESAKGLVNSMIAVLPDFVKGLTDMLPQIVDAGAELLMSLANGFAEAMPTLLETATDTIINLAGRIAEYIPQLVATGVNLLVGLTTGLIKAIPQLIKAIPQILSALIKGLVKGINELARTGLKLGKAIIDGILNGILGGARAVVDGAKKVFGFVKDTIKGIFGIHSPSKWAAEMGEYIMDGFSIGLENGEDSAEKEVEQTFNDLKDAMAKGVESLEEQVEKSADEVEKKALQKQLSQLKDFQKEYNDLWDAIAKKQESTFSKLSQYGDLFTRSKDKYDHEIFEIEDIDKQIDKLNEYADAFGELQGKGVSQGLLDEILKMTVDDASDYMTKLLEMSDEKLSEYVAKYEEKQALAASLSKNIHQAEFDSLNAIYNENMPDTLKTMMDAGFNMMQSMADGINKGESAVVNAAASSISAAISQANAMAGISTTPNAQTKTSITMMNKMAREDAYATKHTTIVQIDGKEVAKAVDNPLRQIGKQWQISHPN